MSTRNHKAIFERETRPADEFGTARYSLEEICTEWVTLEPLSGRELFQAQQVQALTTHKVTVTHSPTMATVKSSDRMKIRRDVVVNEDEPNHDDNFRIFQLESIVNVREANRVFELMVQEKV